MKKHILSILLTAGTLLLTSCGGTKHDPAEIQAALDTLLPPSFELNEIYFGEGLPATDDQALIDKLYGTFAANVKSLKYHPVAADCGYASIEEIMTATEAVFTPEYSAYLYELAFDGISSDSVARETEAEEPEPGEGEIIESGGEITGSSFTAPVSMDVTASYARYLEQNGMLTVRLDLAEDAYELGREYKTGEMKITEEKADSVVVTVPTYMNGEYDCDVDLKLVLTENGWRLDTPTY
ncbi:MAG: hypothetical protein J6D10_05850 [Clostridia bacterium]|nr:hypothetical protein [Clostridia bacterium]